MKLERIVALVLLAVIALVPIFGGNYAVYILPQFLLYGLLAMSLALLWGLVGIVSFGQAAFFALGAYAMGLTMHATELPFNPAYLGLLLAVVIGGVLAAVTGWFLFSAGVQSTYFVLITLALSIIVQQIAISQSDITGGFNGMFLGRMALEPVGGQPSHDIGMYFFVLILVALCYILLSWLATSRFGKVLVGIRENEERLIAFGFKVHLYKTGAFALSGALAGFAGALYATDSGFVSPSMAGVLFSTQIVVWVAIGGRQSLLGALIGGLAVASASNYLSALIPDYWQLIVGIVFMLVIIFFKDGLAGMARQLAALIQKVRAR